MYLSQTLSAARDSLKTTGVIAFHSVHSSPSCLTSFSCQMSLASLFIRPFQVRTRHWTLCEPSFWEHASSPSRTYLRLRSPLTWLGDERKNFLSMLCWSIEGISFCYTRFSIRKMFLEFWSSRAVCSISTASSTWQALDLEYVSLLSSSVCTENKEWRWNRGWGILFWWYLQPQIKGSTRL